MKILITGGNGYIANSLKKYLSSKYIITSITRKDFDLENKNKTKEWFDNKLFDVVIHTAIKGGSRLKNEDKSILTSNLKMFENLINNKSKFKKLISFGSGAEIFQNNTFYGQSKLIISNLIKKENFLYNLRIFGVFDEYEKDTRFIKSNIIRYIKKEPMIIHTNKIMDFIYMKDLIKIVDYYLTHKNLKKEIDCCYKKKYSLIQIADSINNLNSYKVNIEIQNKNIFDLYIGNSNLPIKTIGLEKGIKETYNYLINNT
jgi:nucleoside-diphosphate-sugar epimerase